MQVSARRVLLVTMGLSLIGVICGALLGALALLAEMAGDFVGSPLSRWPFRALAVGAILGAGFGAVLAPLVGWVFLRRVSIGRAIRETAIGALIGIGIGALVQHGLCALLGLAGFTIAGVRLWFATRPGARRNRGTAV